MKLMISGSMTFVNQMVEVKKELEKLGHKVDLPMGTEPHFKDPKFVDDLTNNLDYCIKNEVMRKNFEQIKNQDAILVFNKTKNNTQGYIGVSTLMEMAIAHFLHKKIFILQDIPHYNSHRWAHEVTIMRPVFLHGDLGSIK